MREKVVQVALLDGGRDVEGEFPLLRRLSDRLGGTDQGTVVHSCNSADIAQRGMETAGGYYSGGCGKVRDVAAATVTPRT
jgi:hypothetical protein